MPKTPTHKGSITVKQRLHQAFGMIPRIKQSKTYVQIATRLAIFVPPTFLLSMNLSVALLFLAATSLLVGLLLHKHDE